jgi:hypothetical protein
VKRTGAPRKHHADATTRTAVPEDTDFRAASADAASAVSASNLSLHELFGQQARDMLDSADIDEEQKQAILVSMACPCCGAAAMSFSFRLKPEPAAAPSRPRRPRKSPCR